MLGCCAAARFNKRPYAFFGMIFVSPLPLLAGRGGEGEGCAGAMDLLAGEGRESCGTARWRRISVAGGWSLTQDAGRQQLQAWSPVMRQALFNLLRRPFRVRAMALRSHPASSGLFPDSRVGGCRACLLFFSAGEEDEGPNCVSPSSFKVYCVNVDGSFLILVYCEVLYVKCNALLTY